MNPVNRWKGENVATTEVADVVSLADCIKEANVYGVEVAGKSLHILIYIIINLLYAHKTRMSNFHDCITINQALCLPAVCEFSM